jgi:hypothetical protein
MDMGRVERCRMSSKLRERERMGREQKAWRGGGEIKHEEWGGIIIRMVWLVVGE